MALIGRNVRVEVSKTFGTALVVDTISAANPSVIHYSGTDPTNGSVVLMPSDTVNLKDQVLRVSAVDGTANTFEAESIDGTAFVAVAGAAYSVLPVTAWSTLGVARSMNAGGTAPPKIDATTLIDTDKQTLFGLPDSPDISVDAVSNPLSEAAKIIEAAARQNSILVFRVTFLSNGEKRLFAGYVSLPTENIPLGELVTASFSIVQVGRRLAFAS